MNSRAAGTWFLRIASLLGIIAALVAIGFFMRKGDSMSAGFLIGAVVICSIVFARSWTGMIFDSIASARNYVAGVEGDHRHEWYSFKGQRVRVFLDADRQPWFALNEIAFILALKADQRTFRHYGPHEYGVPATASETCLSESGLRRLIKYSAHPEAGALGLWLEREVLRMLKNRRERENPSVR